MTPYVVCYEVKSTFSTVIFAESEEDLLEKAGQLSTSIKSSSTNSKVSLDDQKICTTIFD
jgi:hypothetical protein